MAIKTVTQQVKEFGAKVVKNGPSGYYRYIGKNFTADIYEDSCVTTWWAVDIWQDNADPIVEEHFKEYNTFDRKKDVVWALLTLDQNYNQQNS